MSANEKTHWRAATPAVWPDPLSEMSASTFPKIEECPLRWREARLRLDARPNA